MNKNFLFIALTIVQVSFAATAEDAAINPAPELATATVNPNSLDALATLRDSNAVREWQERLVTGTIDPNQSRLAKRMSQIPFIGLPIATGLRTALHAHNALNTTKTVMINSMPYLVPAGILWCVSAEPAYVTKIMIAWAIGMGYQDSRNNAPRRLAAVEQYLMRASTEAGRLLGIERTMQQGADRLVAAQDRTTAALIQGAARVNATLEDRFAALNARLTAITGQPQQPALARAIHREPLALEAPAQPFLEITAALDDASTQATRTPSRSRPAATTDTTSFTPAAASPSSAEASETGPVLLSVTSSKVTFGPARPMQEQPTQQTDV